MRLCGLVEPSSLLCHAQLSPALLVLWARELCREEDMLLWFSCEVMGVVLYCVVRCCEALPCVAPCVYVYVCVCIVLCAAVWCCDYCGRECEMGVQCCATGF